MLDFAKTLIKRYGEDNITAKAAALSYFAVFSLGPLMFVLLGGLGLIWSSDVHQERLISELGASAGPAATDALRQLAENEYLSEKAGTAILIGLGGLLLAAIGVFGQLQRSLNDIFRVKVGPTAGKKTIVVQKIIALSLLLFAGLLLLASILSSLAISTAGDVLDDRYSRGLLSLIDFGVSLLVVTLMVGLIYRRLPDVRLPWRVLLIGAAAVSVMLWLGTFVLGLIIGGNATVSAFGAAGSVVALLLWMYYSGLILYLGALGISVYAHKHSVPMTPRYSGEGGVMKLVHKYEPLTPKLTTKVKKNFKRGVKKGLNKK